MMRTRYSIIHSSVCDLIVKLGLGSYPIDIYKIIKSFKNCRAVSYSKHAFKYNLSDEEVIEHFGTDEGCTIYNPENKRYLIFYNDLNKYYKSPRRIRWTLAHELGHIILKHHLLSDKTKIFRGSLSDDEYKWMEAEANRFAALLLANPFILHKLDVKSEIELSTVCDLSPEASSYRYDDYLKWCKYKRITAQDRIIIKQFDKFFHRILNTYRCSNCQSPFVSEESTFCPICGSTKIIKFKKYFRSEFDMKYSGYEVNEFGQEINCHLCGNEEIDNDANYCKICGEGIVNNCTNDFCGIPATGNARYCTQCGYETTFFRNKILVSWNDEKTFNQVAATTQSVSDFLGTDEELFPIADEDMPF